MARQRAAVGALRALGTGQLKHRLPAHDPQGFANLVLAGDWTHNNFNLGCVEAAVMSGLLASHALTGYPVRDDIVGMEF